MAVVTQILELSLVKPNDLYYGGKLTSRIRSSCVTNNLVKLTIKPFRTRKHPTVCLGS